MKIVDKLAKEYSDILIEKNKFDDAITMYAYEDFKAGYQAAILEILNYDQELKYKWNNAKFTDIVTIRDVLDRLSREVKE